MAKNIMTTLRDMKAGEEVCFTEGNFQSIISAASTYGFQWRRKYSCSRNRQEYSLTVKRIY